MKTIVIGLDCATWKIINKFKDSMPNFEKIKNEGGAATLDTGIPPSTPPAWTTMTTGVNAGKHGIFGFTKIKRTYELDVVSGSEAQAPRVWDVASEKGKKCAIINVPMTYPPKPLNGILISGMDTPGPAANFTYPSDLKNELKGYDIHPLPFRNDNENAFLEGLGEEVESRFNLVNKYIDENYDLIFCVLMGTDKLSDAMWKYLDELHPAHEDWMNVWVPHIRDYFSKIDSKIGGLMEKTGEEYCLMIVSDHGGIGTTSYFNLSQWLVNEGYLALRRAERGIITSERANKVAAFLEKYKLTFIKNYIKSIFPNWRSKIPMGKENITLRDIDWINTVAFSSAELGGIYVNSENRFDQGPVCDSEYENLRNQIIDKLIQYDKLKIRVWKREELWTGPLISEAPDIMCSYNDFRTGPFSNRGFLFRDPEPGDMSGRHDNEGIILIYNKGKLVLEKPTILDIAPTILDVLGVEIPKELEGRSLIKCQ